MVQSGSCKLIFHGTLHGCMKATDSRNQNRNQSQSPKLLRSNRSNQQISRRTTGCAGRHVQHDNFLAGGIKRPQTRRGICCNKFGTSCLPMSVSISSSDRIWPGIVFGHLLIRIGTRPPLPFAFATSTPAVIPMFMPMIMLSSSSISAHFCTAIVWTVTTTRVTVA